MGPRLKKIQPISLTGLCFGILLLDVLSSSAAYAAAATVPMG